MDQRINIHPDHYSNLSQSGASGPKCDGTGPILYTSSSRRSDIWPEDVEGALLEGLRIYRPRSKNGRVPQRFTRRNCDIAKYILRETGNRRSAKQVGSRLQQIASTCKDEEIILLITCREYVPKDGGTSFNLPQPEVDSSHAPPSFSSPPSFSPSQCTTIKETPSNMRISPPHSLSSEISPMGPTDPFHVQPLHNSVSTPMGYIPPYTSSGFDSPPLPLDFSNLTLSDSGSPIYLGPSSCAPFSWEQNYRIYSCPDSNNDVTSPLSFDDSGVYDFSSPTDSLLFSVYPDPLF